jgi:hypothetical protein
MARRGFLTDPNARAGLYHRVMDIFVGSKVRFHERYRPSQVRWGQIGVIVDLEERRTMFGLTPFVRVRFGDFITPWIEAWLLERAS